MKLSHIGDLVHHLLLFLVLQHHHELALVDARDTCKSIKPKKVRQKEKKMGVANVRLANVRYLGVANVRIWGRQMSDIWGWQMSAWQMYGIWGWQMSEFGGGKCLIYGGGKCLPGKCLTIPLYYGKVQISNKFLKCGQCCAFQKCNQTTLVSACLRTKPPKNSIHPKTRHIQPINVLDDDRRIEVCR